MFALESLPESILSKVPMKDVIGVFLALNFCGFIVVLLAKTWPCISGTAAGKPSPDLEKPASSVRGKLTRPLGGK
jgi:hypothetical protein